eukprot:CAMPEP_0175762636 /NCGR_PEP_ID=MMETSP0097-20121207/67306_1 /TAXON_ID=311494 /ORGANISM="Alexandrium monilatum, Strain CCMP3105" /LENGTH=106 /DNA_ID=CAMNT_0017072305 /DNA_START=79 /DNA_END=402 /DNA_ORIENTATION=+
MAWGGRRHPNGTAAVQKLDGRAKSLQGPDECHEIPVQRVNAVLEVSPALVIPPGQNGMEQHLRRRARAEEPLHNCGNTAQGVRTSTSWDVVCANEDKEHRRRSQHR